MDIELKLFCKIKFIIFFISYYFNKVCICKIYVVKYININNKYDIFIYLIN